MREQQELDFFLTRTFDYEVSMMRETHELLCQQTLLDAFGGDEFTTTILRNALIESFCIHARNLIDFFRNRDKQDFKPMWFTTSVYTPTPATFLNLSLVEKLNAHIAHMSAKRTNISTEKKITAADRDVIVNAVEGEIERFRQHLSAQFRQKCTLAGRYYGETPVSFACTTSTPPTIISVEFSPIHGVGGWKKK